MMKWIAFIVGIFPFGALGQGNSVQVFLDTTGIEASQYYLECSDSTKNAFDSYGSALLNIQGPMTCVLKTPTLTEYPENSIGFISLSGNKVGAILGLSSFIGPSLCKTLVFNDFVDQSESVGSVRSDSSVQVHLEPIASAPIITNRIKIKKTGFVDYYWRRPCWAYASPSYPDGLNISVINRNILYRLNAYPFEGLSVEYENYDQTESIW